MKDASIKNNKINYPVNLLETEVCDEVRELLATSNLALNSAHQSWLLMAILYLVERERRKALRGLPQVGGSLALGTLPARQTLAATVQPAITVQ